ncbi:hypothetical protein SVIOM342S_08337 [Streptomyces violaceorubidus]
MHPEGLGWDEIVYVSQVTTHHAASRARRVPGRTPACGDTTKETVAEDVGIDGGAAGAEEAAVHVVEDETELPES